MKVIRGKYKGRKIEGFNLEGTRPTMDRIKESLFAMIQDDIDGSIILDLFSGSGNLGIEALSLGSSFAYLVDDNKKARDIIQKNIQNLQIPNAKVLHMDYKKALSFFKDKKVTFDLVFLDPPYQSDFIEKSISYIEEYQLVKLKGMIICESNDKNKIIYPISYQAIKEKKYKDKWVVILQKIC